MTSELNHNELLKLLLKVQFDERYYSLYEQFRDRSTNTTSTRYDVTAALASTRLDFTFHMRERFYAYKELYVFGSVGLHLALPHASVELILVLQVDGQQIGGPFPALARRVALLRDPGFLYEPRSPKIPFSNPDQLRQVVQQGVGLFREVQRAILARFDAIELRQH